MYIPVKGGARGGQVGGWRVGRGCEEGGGAPEVATPHPTCSCWSRPGHRRACMGGCPHTAVPARPPAGNALLLPQLERVVHMQPARPTWSPRLQPPVCSYTVFRLPATPHAPTMAQPPPHGRGRHAYQTPSAPHDQPSNLPGLPPHPQKSGPAADHLTARVGPTHHPPTHPPCHRGRRRRCWCPAPRAARTAGCSAAGACSARRARTRPGS